MKNKNFTLKSSLAFLFLAFIILQPVLSQKKIAFVTQAFNGGSALPADDSTCIDALWKNGFVVDTCKDFAIVDTIDGSDSRKYFDRLNAADIVIISRSTNSGNYQTANRPFWLNVRKPVMLASSYIARTNRLNFINSTSTSVSFKRPLQTVAKFHRPKDYIVRHNVTLNSDSSVYFFTGIGEYPLTGADTLERSSNFKLIASGSDSAMTFPDCIVIARLAAGTESYTGSGFIAKSPRTFFCFGASNNATMKPGDTRNNFKFTEGGKKVFFNEIAYLLGDTLSTGINKFTKPLLKISVRYNTVIIASDQVISKIRITDIQGKVVCTQNLQSTDASLSVKNLDSGIYTVTVKTQSCETSKKIIIVK